MSENKIFKQTEKVSYEGATYSLFFNDFLLVQEQYFSYNYASGIDRRKERMNLFDGQIAKP